MADETELDFPSQEDANTLEGRGLLSKEVLDQVYQDLGAQENHDNKETLSDQIANEILKSKDAQELMSKTAQKVQAAITPPPPNPGLAGVIGSSQDDLGAGQVHPSVPFTPPSVEKAAAQHSQEQIQNAVTGQQQQALSQAQSTVSTGLKDQILQKAEAAFAMEKAGAIAGLKTNQEANAQKAGVINQAIQQMDDEASVYARKRAELSDRRAEQLQKQTNAVEQYNTLNIDPNHFWATQSTPEKIVIGIGLALSALGGKSDQAFKIIDDAIDRDLKVQVQQNDIKKQGISTRSNLIGQMEDVVRSEDDAMRLAKAAKIQQVQLRIQQIAASASSKEASANAMSLIGKLDAQKVKLMADVAKKVDDNLALGFSGDGKALPLNSPQDFAGVPKKIAPFFVPGIGFAASQKAQTDMIEGSTAFNNGLKLLDELIEKRKTHGTEGFGPWETETQAKAEGVRQALLSNWRVAEKTGALDVGAENVFSKIIPDDPLGGLMSRLRTTVPGVGDPLLARLEEARKLAVQKHLDQVNSSMRYILPNYRNKLEISDLMGESRSRQ